LFLSLACFLRFRIKETVLEKRKSPTDFFAATFPHPSPALERRQCPREWCSSAFPKDRDPPSVPTALLTVFGANMLLSSMLIRRFSDAGREKAPMQMA